MIYKKIKKKEARPARSHTLPIHNMRQPGQVRPIMLPPVPTSGRRRRPHSPA